MKLTLYVNTFRYEYSDTIYVYSNKYTIFQLNYELKVSNIDFLENKDDLYSILFLTEGIPYVKIYSYFLYDVDQFKNELTKKTFFGELDKWVGLVDSSRYFQIQKRIRIETEENQ